MKQVEIELGIYLYTEEINYGIFLLYFLLFVSFCKNTVCVLSDLY